MFYIRGENIKQIKFYIYNRWGERVYKYEGSDNNNNGWDGTFDNEKLNPGVFMYYGTIEYVDGKMEDVKGNVTLVR